MNLTQDTHMIFIHGLASKPAESVMMDCWQKALIENIRVDSKSLARAMEGNADLFHSAYWANAIPDHIEDSTAYVNKLKACIDDVITMRQQNGKSLHISKVGWVKSKVQEFGLDVVNTLAAAITIKDNVIDEHMREVRLYNSDQYIADRIRAPLEQALRNAWDNDKHVVLLSHSMGTFISYDVLWRFSHRHEPEYKNYRKQAVDLFITMGSPMGDAALREFMLVDRWKDSIEATTKSERKRYFPANVRQWHNYSAYGDVVCHDATLEDDFFKSMRANIVGFGKDDLRDYTRLYNPFQSTHKKPNPHKSYGYLIQPKLSQKIREFFL